MRVIIGVFYLPYFIPISSNVYELSPLGIPKGSSY